MTPSFVKTEEPWKGSTNNWSVTVSDDEKPTPALFDHAVRVYEEMLKRSSKDYLTMTNEEAAALDADPQQVDVYEGHLTRLFADLNIANPYYTKIMNTLVELGCVEQLRRGGGKAQSKWVLCKAPVEDIFKDFVERKRQPQTRLHQLEQRIKDLVRITQDQDARIERLEAASR